MKLRKKFVIILLIITFVLSGIVYGQLEFSKHQAVDRVDSTVNESAALTAEQIDEEIQRQTDYVGYFASRPAASNESEAFDFLGKFLSNPRFYAVQTIDENGTVTAFQGDIIADVRQETIGADLRNRSYVAVPLETGETYVSNPERVNATGQYVVIISAPIFEDGEVSGVLAAAVELNRFSVFSTLVPLQTESQSVSVTDGSTTLYSPEKRFSSSISGEAVVPSTGWVVEVRRDRAPLNDRLRRMALMQGGSLLLVLFSVIGLAIYEYSATLKQTERLLAGFEALQEGAYDHHLNLTGGEEWEKIGAGFNELSQSLDVREQAITEREEQLSVLNRVLRHNLRNDMTLILNYASMVAEGAEKNRITAAGRSIKQRGEHLIGLSEKARQVSKAIGQTEDRHEMDLAAQARDTITDVQSDYPDASVSIDAPAHVPVTVIPSFELALENVIDNGLEHNDTADPRLDVSITTASGQATLVVADNGPGIPDEEWAALEGEEEPLEHGSGLGLWLIYWLVHKSGGRLEFEANEPRGSIVRIVVPLSD